MGATRQALSSSRFRRFFMAVIILVSLGLVLAACVMTLYRPCRQAGISFVVSTPDCPALLEDSPLLVALVIWALGTFIWLVGQHGVQALFYCLLAGVLGAGKMSAISAEGGVRVFYAILPWIAPSLLVFCVTLLGRPLTPRARWLLSGLCIVALALSTPFLVWTTAAIRAQGMYAPLRMATRLFVASALTVSVMELFNGYRRAASLAVHQRLRLVALGSILAFAPLLLLSMLPDTLHASWHVPYEITIACILLSPISYVYALYRYRFSAGERRLDRAAVYYLLTVMPLAMYLALDAIVRRLIPPGVTPSWYIEALMLVSSVYLFVLLQRTIGTFVHWGLWGNELAYAAIVDRFSSALSVTLDRLTLQHLLVDELASSMMLSQVALWLKGPNDLWVPVQATGVALESLPHLPVQSCIRQTLQSDSRPSYGTHLVRNGEGGIVTADEQALLAATSDALYLPLLSGGEQQGMLLIWPRDEGGGFTAEESRILGAVVRQAGMAAHNVGLIEDAEAGRRELSRAHRQLLAVREDERREIARVLHDDVIQPLIVGNYQIAETQRLLRNGSMKRGSALSSSLVSLENIRQHVKEAVAALRSTISDLRPVGLDDLGIAVAIESFVARLRAEHGSELPDIGLDLDRTVVDLPEVVSICVFRTGQEAVRNALKHARARHVEISFHMLPEGVRLVVRDDGCGFPVPVRLTEFAQGDHFGLVGMAERVAWIDGVLTIHSEVGVGTEIQVFVPTQNKDSRNGQADSGHVS